MAQISFRQGIIRYPSTGSLQAFLVKSGANVNLQTTNGIVDVALAHKDTNYLLTETTSIPAAWTGIPPSTDTWIYWDINLNTGVRTFGQTLLAPVFGTAAPSSPQEDQHWFNTLSATMFVFSNGFFREVIRVFAAKVNNTTFTPMGTIQSQPFAGSQVGLNNTPSFVGRIIFDDDGNPIRRRNGTLFTTEDQFYINGSPANTLKFEANVLTAIGDETIPQFSVVKLVDFGKILLAGFNDLNTTFIGMAMQNGNVGEVVTMVSQGTITNPVWDWQVPGAPLWVLENGELTEDDPNLVDTVTYPTPKPPIARIITPTQIFFDQGLGGRGAQGDPGEVSLATDLIHGISRLSVSAVLVSDPIVVGDNDPRNTNARVPLAHSQAASTILTPTYLTLTAPTLDFQLQQLYDQTLKLAGGTMTGALVLGTGASLDANSKPVINVPTPAAGTDAANKAYVDNRSLDNLTDVVITSPVLNNTLSYNGTTWVNSPFPFIPSVLDDLTDVTISAPVAGHILRYNGTQWINQVLNLDDLNDVVITGPVNGQVLTYSAGTWVNAAGGGGGASAPLYEVVYGTGASVTSDPTFLATLTAYDEVFFSVAKTGGDSTGLANDATVYTATVAVDGGLPQLVAVTGSTAQTYTTLISELNADTTGATWALVNGNLRCTSDTPNSSASVAIVDVDLFATLTDFSFIFPTAAYLILLLGDEGISAEIRAPAATTLDAFGGSLSVFGGQGDGTGWGGSLFLAGGDGGLTSGEGGGITILAGGGGTPNGSGGDLSLFAGGASGTGDGGDVQITCGSNGGSFQLTAGNGTSSGISGGIVTILTGTGFSAGPGEAAGFGGGVDIIASPAGSSSEIDTTAVGGIGGSIGLSCGSGGNADSVDDGGSPEANGGNGGDVIINASSGGAAFIFAGTGPGDGDADGGNGGSVLISALGGGDADVPNDGNADGGDGGDVEIAAGARGTASVGGVGTATNGRPGNILERTTAGFWQKEAGGFAEGVATNKTFLVRNVTVDDTATELFRDGTQETLRIELPDVGVNLATWKFDVHLVAHEVDNPGMGGGWHYAGVIYFDSTGPTTALIGTIQTIMMPQESWTAGGSATISITAGTGTLDITVTAPAGTVDEIYWHAYVNVVEVTFTDT